MPKKVIALCMNTEYRPVNTCFQFKESGCLGVQPKVGGKFLLKLNNGERPIANKYREGKMQRTLKRELKVLEIVKREAIGSSACCLSTHLLLECWSGVKRVICIGCLYAAFWHLDGEAFWWYDESLSVKWVGERCEGGDEISALVWLFRVKLCINTIHLHWGNLWLKTGAFLAE